VIKVIINGLLVIVAALYVIAAFRGIANIIAAARCSIVRLRMEVVGIMLMSSVSFPLNRLGGYMLKKHKAENLGPSFKL
jgi:hypothetical protein